ncbi:hypothetical protein JCM1841_006350 [Sporobolomyces salmonicolor]
MAAPFELAYTPPLAAVPAWLSYTLSPTATVVAPYTVATFAENGNPTLQVAQATVTQYGTNLIQLPITVSLEAVESGEPQVDLGSLYTTAGGDGPTVGHFVGGTQMFTIGSQTRALAGSQPPTVSQSDRSSATAVESSQATPTRQASLSQASPSSAAIAQSPSRTTASTTRESFAAPDRGETTAATASSTASAGTSVSNAMASATLPSSSSASSASSNIMSLPSSFVTSRYPSSNTTSRPSSSALTATPPHSLSSLTPSQLAAAIAAPIAFVFLLCLLFALCCCLRRGRRKRGLYAAAGIGPASDDTWDWVQPRFLEGGWSSIFGGSRPGTSVSRRSGDSRSRPGGGAKATGEQSPLAAAGTGPEEDDAAGEIEERPRRAPTALGYAAALPERAASRISAGLRSISGGSSDGDRGGRYQPLAHHEHSDASELVPPEIEADSLLTSSLLPLPSPAAWDPYATSPVTSEFPVLAPSPSLSDYSAVSRALPVQGRGRFGPLGVAAATQGLVELTSPGGWTGYGSPRTDGRAPSETTFEDEEEGETPQLGYFVRQPGLETPPPTPRALRTRDRSSSASRLMFPKEDPGEDSAEEIAEDEDGDVTLSSSRPGWGGGAGERGRVLVSEMGWLSGRTSALESEGSMSRYSQSDTGMLTVPVRDASRASTASEGTSMGHTRLSPQELFYNTPRWTGTRHIHLSAFLLSTTSPIRTSALPPAPASACNSDSISSTSSRFRDAFSPSVSGSPVYNPSTPDLSHTVPDSPVVYTPNSREKAQGHRKTMSTGSVLDRIAASFGGGMAGLGVGGFGGGAEGGWMARQARNREMSGESAADPYVPFAFLFSRPLSL